ncbi:hypothetical protein ACTFRP_20370 [Bacillus cereus group sp. MYBK234-1]|uniref:hypothetical protein n=1 Tax=unclassified Bacillus cereus group TaxID=2750818 RepID=UPI003F7A3B43
MQSFYVFPAYFKILNQLAPQVIPKFAEELATILYISNKELSRTVAMFVGTFEIFVQVSNTTKVIIQCIPVDEEMEE